MTSKTTAQGGPHTAMVEDRAVAAFALPFAEWRAAREAISGRWPIELVAIDVRWLTERQRLYGTALPATWTLAKLWGVSAAEAHRLTSPLRGRP